MRYPSQHHLVAAKRILHYIAGTIDFGLWYYHVSNFKLCRFTDSDWAGYLEDRSISSYIFNLESGAISCKQKKQGTTALSLSEAEYAAATSSACQDVWLWWLLANLDQKQDEGTGIYYDSKAIIIMAKNPAYHGRMKHMDIWVHFIQ